MRVDELPEILVGTLITFFKLNLLSSCKKFRFRSKSPELVADGRRFTLKSANRTMFELLSLMQEMFSSLMLFVICGHSSPETFLLA